MFDYLPHEADIAEQVEHKINNLSLTFDQYFPNRPDDVLSVYASGQTVARGSYYGAEQNPDAYGFSEDLSTIIGAKCIGGKIFDGSAKILIFQEGVHNLFLEIMDIALM